MISMRSLSWLAAVAAALCLILMAARMASVFSFAGPLQVFTSGDEASSLFAVWKFVAGEPVYRSRFEIPYAAIMYNWFFYSAYGAITDAVLALAGLDQAWLPTVARAVSVAFISVTGIAAWRLYVAALQPADEDGRRLAGAFAVLLAAGPLIGFWGMTVRPDLGALMFETLAALAFVSLRRRSEWLSIVAVGVLCFLAWSCKQTSLFTLATAGQFLLLRGRWAQAVALGAIAAGLAALALAVGGAEYRQTVMFNEYVFFFSFEQLVTVATNAAIKLAPALAGAAALVVALALANGHGLAKTLYRDDVALFGVLGTGVTSAVVLPIASQTGSAENYFFPLALYLIMAVLAGWRLVEQVDGRGKTIMRVAVTGGWVALAAAVALVLVGRYGVIDLRYQHAAFMNIKACADTLPRPLYIDRSELHLPWLTPGTEPFVLSYTYARERDAGARFARGGIGGLVAEGHFAAIFLRGGPAEAVDGAPLDGYRRVTDNPVCAGRGIYLRRP